MEEKRACFSAFCRWGAAPLTDGERENEKKKKNSPPFFHHPYFFQTHHHQHQITAEQILREAQELRDVAVARPQQSVADRAELDDYRMKKRKQFEDEVRRVRWQQGAWVKYANWEEAQGDLRRARSVWERALEVDATSPLTWQRYAEMEMRARAVQHARNVWDRATALLPRVDSLWFKYAAMEQVLGNTEGAR